MGQKVNPEGLRVGVIKDWNSKWYADSKHFGDYLVEDHKIREYIKKKLYVAGIAKIEVERTAKFVKVNVYTAKPGLVIGKGGNLAEVLKKELEKINEDNKSLLESLKEALKEKVVDVKVSNRLKSHPVCLVSDQGVSFEMEKVLNAMPDGQDVKAGRILEINPNHDIFKAIQNVYQNNADKINDYASLLFDQALLIEGLSIEDPVAFSNKICELMIELNK